MPLYQTLDCKNTHISIWKHEKDDFFDEKNIMTIEEIEKSQSLSPKKRWEYIMIRQLLHLYSPNSRIEYKENGEPFLDNDVRYISISHSYPFAVLSISDAPIGVDVERISEKILRVRDKFINESENQWLEGKENKEILTAIWSMKEALYKIHPSKLWSLKKHYTLQSFKYRDGAEAISFVHDTTFKDTFQNILYLLDEEFLLSTAKKLTI